MKHAGASGLWAVVLAVAAAPGFAQQASLTLKDADVELCHHNETSWTIAKDGALDGDVVTWTVKVTRGATTPSALSGFGFVRIANTGSAAATLGNIVVNLQRRVGNKWVTASSDVADATCGDAATQARVVPGASSEGKSCFKENCGSGPLSFTDADSNSIFSLVPQFSLPPGQALDLLFHAEFNNAFLNIPEGESVRFEVIVSFGNAGARGGSGASGKCVDINGNGQVDDDEKCVRSVPTRLTRAVPELEECGDSVRLFDAVERVVPTGDVQVFDFHTTIGVGDSGEEWITASGCFTTSVRVVVGPQGGTVTNTATLDSPGDSIVLEGPLGIDGFPIYVYEVDCCPEVDETASHTVYFPGENGEDPPGFRTGDYATYSKGGWGNPASLIWDNDNFDDVYGAAGVEVGGLFSMTFSSAVAVANYLPGGGKPSCLTKDLSDPTKSASGNLGAQILALRFAVDFSDASITPSGFGDLVLDGMDTSLDGLTIRQVLDVANIALGGGVLPPDYGYADLNDLIDLLNHSFHEGHPSAWAQAHLSEDEGT